MSLNTSIQGLMTAHLQLSTVGELRRRLVQLAGDGVPDEATIIIRQPGEVGLAAMGFKVEEDFQPAGQLESGIEEPAGYWTVSVVLEVAAPPPISSEPES